MNLCITNYTDESVFKPCFVTTYNPKIMFPTPSRSLQACYVAAPSSDAEVVELFMLSSLHTDDNDRDVSANPLVYSQWKVLVKQIQPVRCMSIQQLVPLLLSRIFSSLLLIFNIIDCSIIPWIHCQ